MSSRIIFIFIIPVRGDTHRGFLFCCGHEPRWRQDPGRTWKYIEALEENKKLYERLLQTEREKVELLEKMLPMK